MKIEFERTVVPAEHKMTLREEVGYLTNGWEVLDAVLHRLWMPTFVMDWLCNKVDEQYYDGEETSA